MPSRHRTAAPLAAKLTELMVAAPQVMAIRLSRMAAAGNQPTAKDRAEMHRMGNEKLVAFSQSWLAMWMNWWMMPLRLMPAWAGVLGGGPRSRAALRGATVRASNALLAAGLAPVHRTATANARRLARPAKSGAGRARRGK
jgi:hypothetical protein